MSPQGGDRRSRREEIVAGTVEYLRRHGLTGFSLRPLARELGTSDRMLLYYFATREELLTAALEQVAAALMDTFAAGLPDEPAAPAEVLASALAAAAQPDVDTNLRLWLEVVALAARGDPTCAATAKRVLTGWVGWLAARLDVPEPERPAVAAALLALVDGLGLVYLAGNAEDAFTAAGWLITMLARAGDDRG
jgi:AcrR family transcriptional regulator